jgi:hypothetical protein
MTATVVGAIVIILVVLWAGYTLWTELGRLGK